MADDIMVTIGAQIDDLINAFNQGAEGISESLTQVQTTVQGVSQAMEGQLVPAVQAANEHLQQMHSETVNIGEGFEELRSQIAGTFEAAGITLMYEAVEKLGEAIEQAGERAAVDLSLATVLQTSTDNITAMRLAADSAGTSLEVMARTVERLDGMFTKARNGSSAAIESLLNLGFSAEQIHDPLFGTEQILASLKERLEDSQTAQQTMNQLIAELGPRGAIAANAIKEYDGSLQGVQDAMDKVNGLTTEQKKHVHELAEEWNHLKEYVGNTMLKMGAAMQEAAEAGSAGMPGSSDESESMGMQMMAQQEKANEAFQKTTAVGQQSAQEITKASKDGATMRVELEELVTQEMLDNIKQQIAASKSGSEQRIALEKEYIKLLTEREGTSQSDKVKEATNQMLATQRQYYDEVEKFADEWAVQDAEITRKVTEQHEKGDLEIAKANAELQKEQTQLAEGAAKNQMDAIVGGLQQQEDAIKGAYKQGAISAAQEYQQTVSIIQQKLQAQLQYYETLKQLAGENQVEIQKLTGEEVKANQQAGQSIVQAQTQFANNFKQQWQSAFNTVSNSFSSNIAKMIEGGESWRKAMQNICNSILDAIINMIVKWLVQQAVAFIESKIMSKENAVSQISDNASTAATGAMASVAAIPYVGWAMAPEVGASMFALAEGYQAAVASAAGGWDQVPGDQLAAIHKNEMVMSAPLADGIRNMVRNTQLAASGGGSATANVSFHSVDSRSVEAMFNSSSMRSMLAKTILKAFNQGHGR